MFVEIYDLDPAKFLSTPGLAWQAPLKKTKVKLDLLTDIYMLLMVKKELEKEYFIQVINIQKLMTNIRTIMIKIKNHHILNIAM